MNNQHMSQWLGAYLDGELSPSQQKTVQIHLQSCEICRKELEDLQQLSQVLRLAPPPLMVTPADRFSAQVGLQLQRKPIQDAPKKSLAWGWWSIPVGVLAAWAFVQAAAILMNTISLVGLAGVGEDAVGWLFSTGAQTGWLISSLSFLYSGMKVNPALLNTLNSGELLGWSLVLNFLILVVLGGVYWAWLGLYWMRIDRKVFADRLN